MRNTRPRLQRSTRLLAVTKASASLKSVKILTSAQKATPTTPYPTTPSYIHCPHCASSIHPMTSIILILLSKPRRPRCFSTKRNGVKLITQYAHPAPVWFSRLGVRSPTALYQGKEVPKKTCKTLWVPWRPRRTDRSFIQATMLLISCALSRQLHRNQRRSFIYATPAPIYLHCILYKMVEYLSPFSTNKPSSWWEIQLGYSCYY